MLFKINGERNSGTNFLDRLLRINDFPTYVHEYKNNICYYWKHGIPDETIKNKNERVIDIFIFRNLNSWLVSFWKNPYHLKSINEYENFLTEKQVSKETNIYDFRNNLFLNEDDIRLIIKKHLEKTGYKVIGELQINIKKNMMKQSIQISAEVQKLFKNRINLATK